MTRNPKIGPWLLNELRLRGIDTVFGIPGVHTTPMYNGFAESGIRHITPRHEQGAGFMADGYARATGRPAACFVISGPGLTNILTAMGQAFGDSIPMLVLSSVSRRSHLRRGLGQLHELQDQQSMASGVCAFSYTVNDLADLPEMLDQAFSVFASARPRPVHIEIPLDLWEQDPPKSLSEKVALPPRSVPHSSLVEDVAGRLASAENPLIVVGGGAIDAAHPVANLAERLGIPVVMTANGRGVLSFDHPLAVPASPSLDGVRGLLHESDVILALGCEFGPTDFDVYATGMPSFDGKVIRVDIDPSQLVRGIRPAIALIGDAAQTAQAIVDTLNGDAVVSGGAVRASTARKAVRESLSYELQCALSVLEVAREAVPNALMVGDSTQAVYAGNLAFGTSEPRCWFNSATGFGTLGYGLPAAIGASIGRPDVPILCFIGDGGLHFTLGELASLRQVGANVVLVVWNNARYGEIRSAMVEEGIPPVGVELFTPDFEVLAKAYDIPFARPRTMGALPNALRHAAERGGPAFVCLEESVVYG